MPWHYHRKIQRGKRASLDQTISVGRRKIGENEAEPAKPGEREEKTKGEQRSHTVYMYIGYSLRPEQIIASAYSTLDSRPLDSREIKQEGGPRSLWSSPALLLAGRVTRLCIYRRALEISGPSFVSPENWWLRFANLFLELIVEWVFMRINFCDT